MVHRPAKAEARAAELALLAMYRAAHGLRDRVDNGQPQTTASGGAIAAGIEADKRFKHGFARLRRNPRPVILYRQAGLITLQISPICSVLSL